MNKEQILEKFRNKLDLLNNLKNYDYRYGISEEFKKWQRDTRVLIERSLGKESSQLNEFTRITLTPQWFNSYIEDSERYYVNAYNKGIANIKTLLQSMIDEIDEYGLPASNLTSSFEQNETTSVNDLLTNKVFIVHGHDAAVRSEVARLLEQLGLVPIILQEQVNAGATIMEKLEKESKDVNFGIVLYTPCDEGCKSGDETKKSRARQNVVFEHGYLIAKLGRNNVSALVKGEVEIPSDISGFLHEKYDLNGGWKIKLARELKNAGYHIDMNKLS